MPILPSKLPLQYLNVQELRNIINGFLASDADLQNHLLLPLERFQLATLRLNHADKCIDLAIALESLLSNNYKKNWRKWMPHRAAWLYAETKKEKTWAERKMIEFYTHRSQIVHNRKTQEEEDLFLEAQSIFIVCLNDLLKQKSVPNWNFVDREATFRNREVHDSNMLLSAKHDPTSWTIGELKQIDDQLSQYWNSTLAGLQGTDKGGLQYKGDADRFIAEFEAENIPYVRVSRKELFRIHPFWEVTLGDKNEARKWHCKNDVERHVNLWTEAAARRDLRVVIDDS